MRNWGRSAGVDAQNNDNLQDKRQKFNKERLCVYEATKYLWIYCEYKKKLTWSDNNKL